MHLLILRDVLFEHKRVDRDGIKISNVQIALIGRGSKSNVI